MGSNLFVAVGTVKGKKRRVGLRVGGANLDLDGVKRHFEKHPFPVKFDAMPEILEVPSQDGRPAMPLHKAVRNTAELKKVIDSANEEIKKQTGGNPQAAEDLDVKEGTIVNGEDSTDVPAGETTVPEKAVAKEK